MLYCNSIVYIYIYIHIHSCLACIIARALAARHGAPTANGWPSGADCGTGIPVSYPTLVLFFTVVISTTGSLFGPRVG